MSAWWEAYIYDDDDIAACECDGVGCGWCRPIEMKESNPPVKIPPPVKEKYFAKFPPLPTGE